MTVLLAQVVAQTYRAAKCTHNFVCAHRHDGIIRTKTHEKLNSKHVNCE